MKLKTFILVFSLVLAAATGNARTFVVVTGISNYGDSARNLTQTTKDAKRFHKLMASKTKDITLLTSSNVTKKNVLEKLRAVANRAQEDDCIVFFFSGHGMPGAISTYDWPLFYTDIVKVLDSSAAKARVCFIDACHAGTAVTATSPADRPMALQAKPGHVFLVSSRPDEYSTESRLVGAGYFTQALIKGLRGKADSNGDRRVTVAELFQYVHRDVASRSAGKQHPQLIAPKDLHDLVVADWTE